METAPKDGREVLLAWRDPWARRVDIGYYERSMIVLTGWRVAGVTRAVEPSHWMPVPTLPDNDELYQKAVQGRREFRTAYRVELEDNRQLRAALAAVRVKALPAGAAVGLQREGWEDRCREVLDIIDAALAAGEKVAVAGPSLLRPAEKMEPSK